MGSCYGGRVQCILLSTLNGYVIYESFYDQFNDIQKAEIRTSFDDALGSHDIQHGLDVVGRFKYVIYSIVDGFQLSEDSLVDYFVKHTRAHVSLIAGMGKLLAWCQKK
jgi:hypothetical protein